VELLPLLLLVLGVGVSEGEALELLVPSFPPASLPVLPLVAAPPSAPPAAPLPLALSSKSVAASVFVPPTIGAQLARIKFIGQSRRTNPTSYPGFELTVGFPVGHVDANVHGLDDVDALALGLVHGDLADLVALAVAVVKDARVVAPDLARTRVAPWEIDRVRKWLLLASRDGEPAFLVSRVTGDRAQGDVL
jgi:hypothetical protein